MTDLEAGSFGSNLSKGIRPADQPITVTAQEGLAALYGQGDEPGYATFIEHAALWELTEIDRRLLHYQDEVTNLGITPAQVFEEGYFTEFDTAEDPNLSYAYQLALFRFAYDYFRARDEERVQMKYRIHLAHRAILEAREAAGKRASTTLHSQIGKAAVNP